MKAREAAGKMLRGGCSLANLKQQNGKLGICTGCFDIMHSGHVVFFQQCKGYCDQLVVIVGRGGNIAGLKPGRPVNPDQNRLFLVAAVESVDYAILGDQSYLNGKIDCVGFCDLVKPDVYIVNEDDSGLAEKKDFCDARGIEIATVPRSVPEFLHPISTTALVEKLRQQSETD